MLIIFNGLLWRKVKRLEKRPDNQYLLNNPKNNTEKLDKDIQDLYEINSKLSIVAKRGICKLGVTKFNALGDKNGNQSFAIALLNYKDNGIVISNLQTNHGSRLYIRQIRENEEINGVKLLPEEKKALERAKQVVF